MEGGGARGSGFFLFTKNPNLKKNFFYWFIGGGGCWGRGREGGKGKETG